MVQLGYECFLDYTILIIGLYVGLMLGLSNSFVRYIEPT